MTDENGPRWRYERGEGRTKHLWHNDYAGFEPSPKGPVGKCPKSITRDLAEELLNKEAIPFYESEDSQWPDRFHAVYRGRDLRSRAHTARVFLPCISMAW